MTAAHQSAAAQLVDLTVLPATREERELWVVAERTPWGADAPDRTVIEGPVAAWRFETWRAGDEVWTVRVPVGTFTNRRDGVWWRTTYDSQDAAEHECRVAAAMRAEVLA